MGKEKLAETEPTNCKLQHSERARKRRIHEDTIDLNFIMLLLSFVDCEIDFDK